MGNTGAPGLESLGYITAVVLSILLSPRGSSVHGILQARILEWVALPFSRGLSNPGIELRSPAFQADSLPSELPGKHGFIFIRILGILDMCERNITYIFFLHLHFSSCLHCAVWGSAHLSRVRYRFGGLIQYQGTGMGVDRSSLSFWYTPVTAGNSWTKIGKNALLLAKS